MRPQSAKAKGRRLQQEVRDAILQHFRGLTPDDVRSTSMGASGTDVLLSTAAKAAFPYYVECKNVESLNVWKALEQAENARGEINPLLVIRRNNTPAYAVIRFDHFMNLVVAEYDQIHAD